MSVLRNQDTYRTESALLDRDRKIAIARDQAQEMDHGNLKKRQVDKGIY